MKTYYLITNVSGNKYWSYLGTRYNTNGIHASMVKKYGNIYINQSGGWFDETAVKTVHKIVRQKNFPTTD